MQALLRLMSNLYAPQFIASSLWPESIKKDFVGELSVATAAAFQKDAHPSLSGAVDTNCFSTRHVTSYI